MLCGHHRNEQGGTMRGGRSTSVCACGEPRRNHLLQRSKQMPSEISDGVKLLRGSGVAARDVLKTWIWLLRQQKSDAPMQFRNACRPCSRPGSGWQPSATSENPAKRKTRAPNRAQTGLAWPNEHAGFRKSKLLILLAFDSERDADS